MISRLRRFVRRLLRRGPQRVVVIIGGVVALLVLAVTAAVIVGGGDEDEAEATPPTTTTSTDSPTTTTSTTTTTEPPTTTTTSPWSPEEQEVIDAYRAAWAVVYEASAPPEANPDDPRIPEHFTDIELDRRIGELTALRNNGGALVLPNDSVDSFEMLSVRLATQDGRRTATVRLCHPTDVAETVLETGATIPSYSGVRTYDIRAVLHREGGRWKVADNETLSREEGVVECSVQ